MFRETMRAAGQEAYINASGTAKVLHSSEQQQEVWFYSARTVVQMVDAPRYQTDQLLEGPCLVEVTSQDSFEAAEQLAHDATLLEEEKPPLVLNFANPYEPGGGVLRGARAQEEDLCRRSTLYRSLRSSAADAYYEENKKADPGIFTHNALLTPCVDVFRDTDGSYLNEPFTVAVLTMAAPYVPDLPAITPDELRAVVRTRIRVLLHLAARNGYTRLVLGAWGCGAFRNDPHMMAEAFRDELHGFRAGLNGDPTEGPTLDEIFCQVRFAIPGTGTNYQVFSETMGDWKQ